MMKPFPTGGSFTFPPMADSSKLPTGDDADKDSMVMDEGKEDVRKAVLEFMISFGEEKSGAVRKVDGWEAAIVRGCLEGIGEHGDDDLEVWLEADVRLREFFGYLMQADHD
jgi:importin-5